MDEGIEPDVRGLVFVESLLQQKLDNVVIFESLKMSTASPTFLKQAQKDLNHCFNADADPGVTQKIDDEIDNYNPPPNDNPPPTITEDIREAA